MDQGDLCNIWDVSVFIFRIMISIGLLLNSFPLGRVFLTSRNYKLSEKFPVVLKKWKSMRICLYFPLKLDMKVVNICKHELCRQGNGSHPGLFYPTFRQLQMTIQPFWACSTGQSCQTSPFQVEEPKLLFQWPLLNTMKMIHDSM